MLKKKSNGEKFGYFMLVGCFLFFALLFLTLKFGASTLSLEDIKNAFLHFDKSDFTLLTIRDIRLPRWFAGVIVGCSLAVAGAIMQGTTKNPMADSGLMGISAGATLGIVIMIAFFPGANRFSKMLISSLGAGVVTLLIYIIAFWGGNASAERMVLSGMAISSLFSSLISAIILKKGLMSRIIRYTSGSFSNVIWADIFVALPFFLCGIIIAIIIARSLTVLNLGEEVSKGLGANVILIKTASTIVVLILSAVSVIILGPVGYVGLLIPYMARHFVGSDYRYVLPLCGLYGAIFVNSLDLLAKLIHPGLEFPLGLLVTIIGVPFFIYISRQQEGVAYEV